MEIDAPEIAALRKKVSAANDEFHFALACHETWKPAAYDSLLHERIGRSYATNTFLLIRQALRREMLLALMRVWDATRGGVGMQSIANLLRDKRIIEAMFGNVDYIVKELGQRAAEAIELIDKYMEGGSGNSTLKKLRTLRDQHLAHRQLNPAPIDVSGTDALDKKIEAFYQDTSTLIRLLLHVVEKTAYNPEEAADVHARYAAFFWAAVRGERTEGHPQYRPPSKG